MFYSSSQTLDTVPLIMDVNQSLGGITLPSTCTHQIDVYTIPLAVKVPKYLIRTLMPTSVQGCQDVHGVIFGHSPSERRVGAQT
jgi:hypothetical protein